jgi:hypothetical protein
VKAHEALRLDLADFAKAAAAMHACEADGRPFAAKARPRRPSAAQACAHADLARSSRAAACPHALWQPAPGGERRRGTGACWLARG